MQKIIDILEAHSAPEYFSECDSGKRLLAHKAIIEPEIREEVWELPPDRILPALRRALSNEELTKVLRRHEIAGRVTKSQLSLLRELLSEILIEQELFRVAERLGCSGFRWCILCPEGKNIVARKIYDYAMGPT